MCTLHAFMLIIMVYYASEIEASSFTHKDYTWKSCLSMCNEDNLIKQQQ